MDSRMIYAKCEALLDKVVWLNEEGLESAYRYVGVGDEFEEDVAEAVIARVFKEESIFLVLHRRTSREIAVKDAVDEVRKVTETEDVVLVDKDFRWFIEFNDVGSYRVGQGAPARA